MLRRLLQLKLDNATRSKHTLNAIPKSCEVQNN